METSEVQQEPVRRYGMASSAGGREYNEDSCSVMDYASRRVRRYLCFMAVADGMGGHHAGDIASQVAIEMLQGALDPNNFESEEDFRERAESILWEAFSRINSHVYDLGHTSGEEKQMGTTLTCAVINAGSAYIAHVGDTRAYLVSSQGARQLTEDHSVVGKMVAEGVLTEEQALTHQQRNVITRAIGPEPNVEIDILRVPARPGDALVICTDGLYTRVNRDEIARFLLGVPDPQEACDRMVDLAIARQADDNVTAVAWRMPGAQSSTGRAVAAPRLRRPRPRWWLVAVVAALMVAIGFGVGWGLGALFPGSDKEPKKSTSEGSSAPSAKSSAPFPGGASVKIHSSQPGIQAELYDQPDGEFLSFLPDDTKLEIVSGPRADTKNEKWYKVQVVDQNYRQPQKTGYTPADDIVRDD